MAVYHLRSNASRAISFLGGIFGYLAAFARALFLPKAKLAARLLAAESQLALCKQRIQLRKDPRPRFTPSFRLLWVILSKAWDQWRDLAHLMQPATVKRWHTTVFRFYWRWKSSRRPGRPPIPEEMQALIKKLSQDNPLWGAERIQGTLRLLGYEPPGVDTVRKYMVRGPHPSDRSTTWLPFLRNHLGMSWAIDLFTVVTARFSLLYVFVVLDHGRRRVIHFATTYHPSMEWVIQQFRGATPFGLQPRYLFRDNDGIYGHGVGAFLDCCGIEEVRTAYRCPWQNPYVERFVGTLRRELLDHVIVLNERHLNRLLGEYVEDYYHAHRPHQGLEGQTPIPQRPPLPSSVPSKLVAFPVVGGLHHRYERIAA